MPRKDGFDLAQLDTGFLHDPKFERLRRATNGDSSPLSFLASVGLWTIALAAGWRNDNPDVSEDVLAYDVEEHPLRFHLETADLLIENGAPDHLLLSGLDGWTAAVKARRAGATARKRKERAATGKYTSRPVTPRRVRSRGVTPGHGESP